MSSNKNRPATKLDLDDAEKRLDQKIDGLDQKINVSVERLDQKIDGLDQKINVSVERLDQKIDGLDQKINVSVERLDQKIDASTNRLAKAIVETQAKLGQMEERMIGLATKDDVNRIMNAIDTFAGKATNYDRAAVLHGQALTEHGIELKQHDNRLTILEVPRP